MTWKARLILICISVILCLGMTLSYFGFGLQGRHQPIAGKQPVYWLSEDKLILLGTKDLFLRDFADGVNESVFFAIPIDRRASNQFRLGGCYSEDTLRLGLRHSSEADARGYGSSHYRLDLENEAVNTVSLEGSTSAKPINRFDCQQGTNELVARHIRSFAEGREPLLAVGKQDHFSSKDVRDLVAATDLGRTILEYINSDSTRRIVLERPSVFDPPSGFQTGVTKDRGAARYLAYLSNAHRSDMAKKKNWPMSAWVIDFEQNDASKIELPAGPWVKEHPESLACFSCGCGCYRNLDMYLSGDRVYAHVWGRGYPRQEQGIFAIDAENTRKGWKLVAKGVIARHVAFSPDGCRMAYAHSRTTVLDLCSDS
ncbi:hypothetical protein PH7735_02615 [Shimia thalassica]|uniref:Uncharacterized protein n=1 Tax=Shimia thalassica TaxID=1715693 RepID=A0A0P1IB65_9RHOB|nr:hypothetical protein [Shimia thalassica]CUK02570.1 hypothetical protein PH7735_02615 [Shimia thalassica]